MLLKKLREKRNSKGISAKEMTDALGLKTEGAYYKKESGMNRFSLSEAKIISELLQMPIDDIFFAPQVSCEDTKDSSVSEKPTGTCG